MYCILRRPRSGWRRLLRYLLDVSCSDFRLSFSRRTRLAMSNGSGDSLKLFVRCGCSPKACQMRCTLIGLTPVAFASVRVLQWVAPRGVVSNVRVTTASTCVSLIVRGAPGRGSSSSPSPPLSINRCRQRPTVGFDIRSFFATVVLSSPAAHARTDLSHGSALIRHRLLAVFRTRCRLDQERDSRRAPLAAGRRSAQTRTLPRIAVRLVERALVRHPVPVRVVLLEALILAQCFSFASLEIDRFVKTDDAKRITFVQQYLWILPLALVPWLAGSMQPTWILVSWFRRQSAAP